MKILISGIVIFLLTAAGFVYLRCVNYKLQTVSPTSPQNAQSQSVNIELSKKEYKQGGSITFTIINDTEQNIYYYPETCASSLVDVFMILDNQSIPIRGKPKICMLAPSVHILPADQSITNKIPDKTLSKMTSGAYKIQFRYSFEMRNRFRLGESILAESTTFTVR